MMTKKKADNDLIEQLENASQESAVTRWKGTFREFLRLFETKEYSNIGALSHQRIYNMIVKKGSTEEDFFGNKRKRYAFFETNLFGVEETIDGVMSYIHSASQKTETARRLLLLYGPPSSGKSSVALLLKQGLEDYSRTKDGAVFAIAGSKMHENPFLLVPEKYRPEFEKQYGLKIEGFLSPSAQYRLEHEFDGKFMDFPVEQIFLSEAGRVGIGTYLPSDPKSANQSELVGEIDFAKIQEYGVESDPRAFSFDGELNVANRGMVEFIEGLRADERFLRILLTATQEKSIKAPRFGLIYVDVFILMHCNEPEFNTFMSDNKYQAYHDRMVVVRVPYNLGVSNEVKIYKQLLDNSDALKGMHIAPKTLESAAMTAILSRLEPVEGELTLVKKMKLYNGDHVKGFKSSEVPKLKKKHRREGMFGLSPRFIIDQISAAISLAKDEGRDFVTALDVLRQLIRGIHSRDTFTSEEKNKYDEYIDSARGEWNELLRLDIQKAFFLSFEDEARILFENYIDQIEISCGDTKPLDPITGKEVEANEKLMDAIESHIEISSSGKEDFRNEIMRAIATAALKKKTFDYTEHTQLRESIQKQLFEERKSVIRLTVSSRNPDPDGVRRLNEVIARMVDAQGYTPASANELLKYATAHLFDK